VYQGQKVHIFLAGLSVLAEAQPRFENRRDQKVLFGRGAHELQKLQIDFVSTFFK
jgi:hypothetical protein